MGEENLSVLKLKRKKKEERKHQPGKMCVRYTLLIANSLLALLGLLLLAGGVWRIVDEKSQGSGKRHQRHSGVGRCKGGGDWPGGRCQGGVHPQVLQLCPTGDGRDHPPCCSLWILWSQKGESVPPLPLQHLRLHHPPSPDRRHRLHQR